jgi:hypothetical protein
MSFKVIGVMVGAVVVLALTAACDDEPGGFPGNGLDDGNPAGDSDADADDCSSVSWGSGLEVGQSVANWAQTGYIDSTGDYAVEETEVEFDLEDVNCAGHDAIVLMIGDTT